MSAGRMISFQFHGMPQQLGEVIWREDATAQRRYGFRFQQPLSLRELAKAALRIQPFGPGAISGPINSPVSNPVDRASAA